MMLGYLTDLWNMVLPALGDHLWQSTLFAIPAALLTLIFERHSARIRYAVWLVASLKFLLPFWLLVSIGAELGLMHTTRPANPGIYLVAELTEPFTATQSEIPSAVLPARSPQDPFHWKELTLGLWLSGFSVVFVIWIARWWRVSAIRRRAAALSGGRELSILRRLESTAGMAGNLKLLLSASRLEPGVFGIFRPVLLWPKSISERLDDSQLEAVLAHELCHVRRRDNMAAALQMLVESIFWFHPLVWWLGARLIEERERACDEAVVGMGSPRHIYAESILKVCQFSTGSPLTCVSGVTGSDLKKRMVHIMSDGIVRKLDFNRKLLLSTAAGVALLVPVVYGLFNPPPGLADTAPGTAPRYVDVSVKPHPLEADSAGRTKMMMSLIDASFTANYVTIQQLIQMAYHVQDSQLTGAPDWLNSARYDINAHMDKGAADELRKLGEDQRVAVGQQLLQGLLADQFKLKVHQGTRELPVYELTVGEGGSKLQKAGTHGFMRMGPGELSSDGTPLGLLTAQLSTRLGRTVVDKTGLTGNYAYTLRWTPDSEEQARLQAAHEPVASTNRSSGDSAPPLLTAIQEQLGLSLQPQTDPVPVLVIDHIEQPEQGQ
jgi:bla regulator protein blaR1